MQKNPKPSEAKVGDYFERFDVRRYISKIEGLSAYYETSYFDRINKEWGPKQIQFFNFCSLANLRAWGLEGQEEKERKTMETSDLVFATTAVLCGLELLKLSKDKEGKSSFTFEQSEELTKFQMDFINGKIRVNPKAFFDHHKNMKSMLYTK